LRFETLHLSFSAPYWYVRTLSPIVQAMSGIVEVAETQVSECSTVRLQLIRHDLEWLNALVPEELSHEFQCRALVSALLNQDVEYFAFTIHGAPQVHLLAADVHKNFVQVPDVECGVTALTDSASVGLSEFQHPQTHRLVADVNAAFSQQILDIAKTHRETKIEPNGSADNVGVKAVAPV
jgi:hypothetical protein